MHGQDLPPTLRDFYRKGMAATPEYLAVERRVPTVSQMERPFKGGLQRAYLHGKALELICHAVHDGGLASLEELSDVVAFSAADYAKLEKAAGLHSSQPR